jgi:Tfp pilus assembly PilM family ATPase
MKMNLKALNLTNRRTPIGLDIGDRGIRAVQLEPSGAGLRIVAAASAPRPLSAAPGAAGSDEPTALDLEGLPQLLDRNGFVGNRVVLAAPSALLLQSVLELPPRSSNAPIEQLARLEMARVHRCGPETFEMGCWDLPASNPTDKGTHLMAVGLPHARSEGLLDLFDAVGLRVEAIDVAACALARACAPAQADGAITAVMNVGWGAAVLCLLYKGAVIYGRILVESGIESLHKALTGRLGLESDVADYLLTDVGLATTGTGKDIADKSNAAAVDLPEDARALLVGHVDATVQELLVSFSYATHQHPEAAVAKVLLVGSGATIPGVAEQLQAALGIPVVPTAPAGLVSCRGPLLPVCSSPALTLAAGLAQFPEL